MSSLTTIYDEICMRERISLAESYTRPFKIVLSNMANEDAMCNSSSGTEASFDLS